MEFDVKWVTVFISSLQSHIVSIQSKCNDNKNDSNLNAIWLAVSSHYLYQKKKLFATGLTNFKSKNLKVFKELLLRMTV